MKFSIITPVYNGERFIKACLESVANQMGDFEVEHVVMDGGSTDRTIEILRKFEENFTGNTNRSLSSRYRFKLYSGPDKGMYDAINHGFGRATGDLMAWINADDLYLPGAFDAISRVFASLPAVEWVKGVTDYIDADSRLTEHGRAYLYHRPWIVKGIYGREAYFIQQDSVFWRSSLWKKAGPLRSDLKLAGDFDLWRRFAREADLYVLNRPVSCFRRVQGQLSQNVERYERECQLASGRENQLRFYRVFFRIFRRLPRWLAVPFYRIFFPEHSFPFVREGSNGKGFIVERAGSPILESEFLR